MINQRLGNPCKEGNVMQEDTSQKAVAVAANQQNIFFMKSLLNCTCTTPCWEICTLNK